MYWPVVFTWWTEVDRPARRAFIAASLGWMLDSFDVNLYALVLVNLMPALGLDRTTAGSIASLTLLAAAAGGIFFGLFADRRGRTRALMASVLLYSVFTAACGFATTAAQLAIFRVGLGLGMGGEWASGAALVSEVWPDRHRAKALAFMQSSWAIGFALAALVNYLVQTVLGLDWRAVFFVGVLPALFTLWIRRKVREPEMWRMKAIYIKAGDRLARLFGHRRGVTIAVALMNACALFAYWGFNTWVPAYLSTPTSGGGRGFETSTMTGLVVANQIGTWFGYVSFGFLADVFGRRRTYVAYLVLAAIFVWAFTTVSSVWALLALGPIASFFATGHFSGFGTVTSELYPTQIRATAQGFTYNIGRIASAFAPRLVGSVAQSSGFPSALTIVALALLVASGFWVFIPETKGTKIQ